MTSVKSILVPMDFSEALDDVLTYAIGLARTLGSQLYLLHVAGTGENFEANFPVGRLASAARARLGTFLSEAEIDRLRPEYALRIGAPAEEIVRYAEARDVDLIIMGTHGRSGLAHLVMGSVAEQVVRTAPCPVLLIRAPRRALDESRAEAAVAYAAR